MQFYIEEDTKDGDVSPVSSNTQFLEKHIPNFHAGQPWKSSNATIRRQVAENDMMVPEKNAKNLEAQPDGSHFHPNGVESEGHMHNAHPCEFAPTRGAEPHYQHAPVPRRGTGLQHTLDSTRTAKRLEAQHDVLSSNASRRESAPTYGSGQHDTQAHENATKKEPKLVHLTQDGAVSAFVSNGHPCEFAPTYGAEPQSRVAQAYTYNAHPCEFAPTRGAEPQVNSIESGDAEFTECEAWIDSECNVYAVESGRTR